eukprot:5276249-Amphidinium_carterae.1
MKSVQRGKLVVTNPYCQSSSPGQSSFPQVDHAWGFLTSCQQEEFQETFRTSWVGASVSCVTNKYDTSDKK